MVQWPKDVCMHGSYSDEGSSSVGRTYRAVVTGGLKDNILPGSISGRHVQVIGVAGEAELAVRLFGGIHVTIQLSFCVQACWRSTHSKDAVSGALDHYLSTMSMRFIQCLVCL